MTKSEKIEIQNMINDAVQAGIVESIKFIFSDKNKLSELIEDIGLSNAMKNDRTGKLTPESEIFSILNNIK